jgi:hypothetical protein
MDCLNNVQKPKIDKEFDKKIMEQSFNSIMTQQQTQEFLINRGGNKNSKPKDFWEGFANPQPTSIPTSIPTSRPTSRPTTSVTPTKAPISKTNVKFYNGDQILAGDYFDGWNDTYFFNTSTFRNNLSFWENPFKMPETK